MNDIMGAVLVLVAVPIIAWAELQSETNVIVSVLQNKGVEISRKEIRASLNADSLYRQSNLWFVLFAVVFMASLWIFKNYSGWVTSLAAMGIIGSAGLACTMRAMALIRTVKRLYAQSGNPV